MRHLTVRMCFALASRSVLACGNFAESTLHAFG
jgi:hypothetical protein